MITKILTSEEAWKFYNTDHFWEQNRIDGKTREDLKRLMSDGFHLGFYVDEELVCVTKCEHINDNDVEVHTYVPPKYVRHSALALRGHIDYLHLVLGYDNLYTATSCANQSCYNFLRKRLGFQTYAVDLWSEVYRDGELLTIYKLVRTL